MTNIDKWSKKEVWRKGGTNFTVTIEHWVDSGRNPHRWGVYVYIYPAHPYFKAFKGNKMFQKAANALPLHGGPSFLQWHYNNGKRCSIQVGADYNHLHDERFGYQTSPDEAYEVFSDAEELHGYMEAKV